MPNWCQNKVVITSNDQEIIDKITSIAPSEDEPFSMESFMPVPPELQEDGGWYDWSIANWGTKWDMDQVYVDYGPNMITIEYQTAWSPNINFWAEFSTFYPSIKVAHQYYEEGVCFIGEAVMEQGRIDDYSTEITVEIYVKAGAIMNDAGHVDWDKDQNYNLFDAFPMTLAEAFPSKVGSL